VSDEELPAGTQVRLRDVRLDDADRIDAWHAAIDGSGGFNDFGIPHEPVDREMLLAGPLRTDQKGTLIVERIADGTPLGSVSWHKVRYGANPESDAWNVGIELVPEARGRGYGTEAQRLLARWLFATTPVNRVEASTDAENVAEQRSLEKAGFTREGVARGAQFRVGRHRDLVVYSKLRGDPA
jgi:RimJ/RimL family protein N-acetyltransferase